MKTNLILLAICSCIAFLWIIASNAIPPELSPPNSTIHIVNMVKTSGNWEELWMQPDRYIRSPFVTTDNTLCHTTIREEIRFFSPAQLFVCLDIYNGKEKWTGEVDGSFLISSDHNQVYAGVGNTSFITYDAEDGQKVWQQAVSARSISDIVAYDGFVKTDVNVGGQIQVYHVFDAATGTHQENNDVPSMAYNSFASDGQSVFVQVPNSTIQAYDVQNHTLIWETRFNNRIIFQPVFNDGLVFVRTNDVIGTVHALEGETGRVLWRKENVISNIAASNSTALYVTIDGEVIVVDARTGEMQGILKFNTEELDTIDNEGYSIPYYVRAVNDMVFVYFGDTWQLFSFRFSQN